ncbi:alpha/beta fold hydrolase [Nocardioides nitrophenolicus]|uniref:alpha/beta fold hydrolase n=1 Tax=Nocardioides nitrophenolicus TaxID=60489 RepID=UPI0027DC2036|nr:alpha/beta fold hydrolase [Nocardioides nitrophenolicus]MBM7519412.1 dipeptidyl aminopeptidase/acylaminoacyl peptidase [Nocardioides nitrophenolicus]
MRLLGRAVPVALLALLVGACSGAERPDPPTSRPTGTVAPSSQPPAAVPHPVSLPALAQKDFDGRGLRLGEEVARTPRHRQYAVTWRSGKLTVSGRLAVPEGPGPFPTVVLAHGYIDPAVYVNGQGMTRERSWFGDHGYVALHVDYRGHAESDPDPSGGLDMRLGYTEDVINAVLALRAWDGPVDDGRIALVGRSMGGGVVYNALVARPGLVDAAVVFAPVSSDAVDNFERWIRPDPSRGSLARRILREYGEPAAQPAFWQGISARTYFDDITEPVLIHHGTSDDSCPIRWSRATARWLARAGVEVTLRTYPGEEHAFGPRWALSMERTERFLRRHLA